ncbi:MAG: C39 family peptidase [Defluviitaleaceae bacterium]|nr:C39 family peptidase [Defluviitaleaceae bacterium]
MGKALSRVIRGFLAAAVIFTVTAGAGSAFADAEAPVVPYTKYIPWEFTVYESPDFKAARVCEFTPQTVTVVNDPGGGWLLIQTYAGNYWMYGDKDLYYIDKSVDLYDDIDGEPVGSLSPQVVEIIGRNGDWLRITTWMGQEWINQRLRRGSVLLDVPSYNQQTLGYYAGCEIVSFAMMVNYTVSVPVDELVAEMPRSYDPNLGFVGDVRSAANGFSIFPQALLGLAGEYLGTGYDMSGCEMDDLKDQLSEGAPVVVWISGWGFVVHALCLTGYDGKGFYYNDPWTGQKDVFVTYDNFYSVWNKPTRNAGNIYSPRMALSYVV